MSSVIKKTTVYKPCVICNVWPDGPLCQVTKKGYTFPVAKCPNCGLVYSDIELQPDSVLEEDSSYKCEFYAEEMPIFLKASSRYLSAIHKFRSAGKLLDIGCGLGYFLATARDHGWQVTGIDISPAAIRMAQKEFALENVKPTTIDQIAFPDESFDVITLWNCLEHMADPVVSLEKAIKWLKPDGLIALEVPDHDGLVFSINLVLHRLTDGHLGISRYLYGSAEGQHVYLWTARSLAHLFARWNFQVCYLERTNPPAPVSLLKYDLNKGFLKAIVNNTTLYTLYGLATLTQRQNRLLMVFSRS